MRFSKPAACAAVGLSVALMLLVGCGKGGGTANSTKAAAAGAGAGAVGAAAKSPASGPDIAITANDMPRAKAGYWETATTTNGSGPEVHKFCLTGKPMTPPAQMGRGCQAFTFKRTALGAYVIDADCAEGPVASKLHMNASGDFNSTYTTDSQVSIVAQGRPASTFTTHSVARWIGPCPAGATPDD